MNPNATTFPIDAPSMAATADEPGVASQDTTESIQDMLAAMRYSPAPPQPPAASSIPAPAATTKAGSGMSGYVVRAPCSPVPREEQDTAARLSSKLAAYKSAK